MNTNRNLEGWVRKSHKLPVSGEHLLIYNLQSIGRFDCSLSLEWEQMRNKLHEVENILKFDSYSFQSSLWVMAAYEIIRILKTIDQRPETRKVYELFRRVRVPMVKFEAPKTRGKIDYADDFGIAMAALGRETNDIGWAVGPKMFISRNELADALYNLYG